MPSRKPLTRSPFIVRLGFRLAAFGWWCHYHRTVTLPNLRWDLYYPLARAYILHIKYPLQRLYWRLRPSKRPAFDAAAQAYLDTYDV